MKIFKFGGASVKDAEGVKNLLAVLETTKVKDLVVVVSAMGKMTNHMEKVVADYVSKSEELTASISFVYDYHFTILSNLFPNSSHPVFSEVSGFFKKLNHFLENNRSTQNAFIYDQVVSFGEMISTTIISHFLSENGIKNNFIDARKCIKTSLNYRDAIVDWDATKDEIKHQIGSGISITQGFIASEKTHNFTTTLGREGSDYTAAIFGYCLNAESVTIWKDVPGVLNADPKHFKTTQLINHISYKEAIELAFYGASVIHPKTLQPLQRKEIPLFVKSFWNPLDSGTRVGKGVALDPLVSCFILKKDQVFISLSSLDFSFMMEEHIGGVFQLLHEHQMKVKLIQNSAISFSVCVDNKFDRLELLLAELRKNFSVTWNEGVTLYTIRHFKRAQVNEMFKKKTVLFRQESRETVQLVVREE